MSSPSDTPTPPPTNTLQPIDFSAESYLGKQIHTSQTFSGSVIENSPWHPHIDVLIVGAGPAGLVAAAELSRLGMSVVVVEEGAFWTRKTFRRDHQWALNHLYQDSGSRLAFGTTVIPITSGRGVGGGTLVNSGISFRTPNHILNEWASEDGVDGLLQHPEWFQEVEQRIGVGQTPPGIAGINSEIARQGFNRLNTSHDPISHDYMPRNASGCIGCGTCQTGCPVRGKADADLNWLPDALRHGTTVYANTEVERLLIDPQNPKRIIGIEGSMRKHDPTLLAFPRSAAKRTARVRLTADRVLLAAGAIATPALMLRSGLTGQNIGKNLHIHPGIGVAGVMPKEVRIWQGATQGYFGHAPEEPNGLAETFSAPPEVFFSQYYTLDQADAVVSEYSHIAGIGFMIRDSTKGSISWNKGIEIAYDLNETDLQRFRRGCDFIVRTFFKAGAQKVRPAIDAAPWVRSDVEWETFYRAKTNDVKRLLLYASHPMGSCRMSADRGRGVVRPLDGQVNGFEGLYVVDSSIMPSALGVNPQITIMAHALGLSRAIAKQG